MDLQHEMIDHDKACFCIHCKKACEVAAKYMGVSPLSHALLMSRKQLEGYLIAHATKIQAF